MIRYIFLFFLTIQLNSSLAQTSFCEAKEMAQQQQVYKNLLEELVLQKSNVLQSYINSSQPYYQDFRVFYGGKLGEATIDNMMLFFNTPFSLKVQEPIDYELFKILIEGNVNNDHQLIYPFLNANERVLLKTSHLSTNEIIVEPLYSFENNSFYDLDGNPVEYWKPSRFSSNNELFIPKETEQVIAIYNPASGEFHSLEDGFFSAAPSAKWSPINQRVYDIRTERPINTFNLEENLVYKNGQEVLVVFKDKVSQENRIASIGTNFSATRAIGPPVSESIQVSPTAQSNISTPTISKSLPSVVVDALAQFLVRRTKEELTLAFFDQFRQEVEASNEFRSLLPKTNFLLQTQEDLFRIPSMGVVWVESFQSDIQNLVPNIERLILTDTAYQDIKDEPSTQAFRLAYNLIDLSTKGESPLDILDILEDRFGNDKRIGGIGEVIQVLNVLGNELQNCEFEETGYLLTTNDMRGMTVAHKKYFTSLIYRKNKRALYPLNEFGTINFLDLLKKDYNQFHTLLTQLTGILQSIDEAGIQYYRNSQELQSEAAFNHSFSKIAQVSTELLEFGFRLKYLTNPEGYYQSSFYKEYYPIIVNTINALGHVQREEYGIFLINIAQILQPIIENRITQTGDESVSDFIKNFLFYGGFMVDILSAQDANDVSGIIQQYALPVGSFRMKRYSAFALDINAFPGLYIGIESGLNNSLKENGVVGVTAPIGIAASWGKLGNREGQAFSLFFPVIDIGAAFSYRWGNESGGFPNTLKWRQILSPGVHAVYGFEDLPISIMLGAQFLPRLRDISDNGFTVKTEQSVWHFGVSAVVDIPLFNIHLEENR